MRTSNQAYNKLGQSREPGGQLAAVTQNMLGTGQKNPGIRVVIFIFTSQLWSSSDVALHFLQCFQNNSIWHSCKERTKSGRPFLRIFQKSPDLSGFKNTLNPLFLNVKQHGSKWDAVWHGISLRSKLFENIIIVSFVTRISAKTSGFFMFQLWSPCKIDPCYSILSRLC